MRARLIQFWFNIQSSYWFIPFTMGVLACVLALIIIALDRSWGTALISSQPWLYANTPEAARSILACVAGSMITVGGVVFAITISSVSQSASQYGPRLLTNFMRDRGNQFALATFTSTFLYCIIVLRSVETESETIRNVSGFVPHLAIFVALILTFASVGILIYFVHHVPQSIHISNVIAQIGNELNAKLDVIFPERIGNEDSSQGKNDAEQFGEDSVGDDERLIHVDGTGYVQTLDAESVFEVAIKADVLIKLTCRPGDFVFPGRIVARVSPKQNASDDVAQQIASAYAWGTQRTPSQDIMFLVNELIEIAARALSPGMNDPYSAMGATDWLSAALVHCMERETPEGQRFDEEGVLRVVAEPINFEELIDHSIGALCPYVCQDRNAATHLVRCLVRLTDAANTKYHREVIQRSATLLHKSCQNQSWYENDKSLFDNLANQIKAAMHGQSG